MGPSRDVGATELAGIGTGGHDQITPGIEHVTVRILPDGRVSADDAARYLGCAPKTLAMWRLRRIGPAWRKVGGAFFIFGAILTASLPERTDLDFIQDRQAGAGDEQS